MKIELWPTDRPIPYARNARKISQAAVDKVAASIKEFGWRQPIVVDGEGVVIAGHTRLLAAKKLSLPEVPVHIAEGLSKQQVKAYRLMDNRSHEEAEWDKELLGHELLELEALDIDLALTGFDPDELSMYTVEKTEGLVDEDQTPEALSFAISEVGDLWILGNHRLLCGDSTKADDVAKLLGNLKPHLMVTDPPYGVEYDANWRNEADRKNGKPYGARAVGKVQNDDKADWREAWALFPGNIAYVWHAGIMASAVADSLEVNEFKIRSQIIWAKNNFAISRGDYHWQHEPCWYAVKGTGNWKGDRSQTTLWRIDKPLKSETGHSTQKPVECMRRPILNNSSEGQAVYDPFLGSGTSIVAAEQTGRSCFGLELDCGSRKFR
jgi:DNA modification methylase